MKKFKYFAFLLIVINLFALTLSGCGKDDTKVVRLNEVVHSIFYAPQYVAIEKGFFKDEGLNIELSTGFGADKSMTALISKNADIALMGPEASIYVYNEGKENYAVNFAQLTKLAGNFLLGRIPEPNFKWENVRGKTIIGGRPGGMPQMVLEYILKQNGLVPFEDVDIITNIQFTATAGSFIGGTGDYTAEFEPTATKLEVNKNAYVVASLGTSSGNIPYTSYMSTKEFIKENPTTIQKFTNALYKAQKWTVDNSSEEIAKAIKPHFDEFDVATLTKIVDRYKQQSTWCVNPVCDENAYKLLQDILEQSGELSARVPFEDLVNNEFANEAIK